jgi:hypothetical protein
MHVGVLRDIAAEEAAAAAAAATTTNTTTPLINGGTKLSHTSRNDAIPSIGTTTSAIVTISPSDSLQKRLNPKIVAGGLQRSNTTQTSSSTWSPSSFSSDSVVRNSPQIMNSLQLKGSSASKDMASSSGVECVNGVCELKQTRFKQPKVQ